MSVGRGDDVRAVANEILSLSCPIELTNLTLQKIIYFLHGQYLISTESPLVSGYFEAWEFGPVHPLLYAALKQFGRSRVPELIRRRSIATGEWGEPPKLDNENVIAFVRQNAETLFKLTAGQLVELSHAKNAPWDFATRTGARRTWGARLDNDLIRRQFRFHKRTLSSPDEGETLEERPPTGD